MGQIHKDALGSDKFISPYGYPDLGNNIYSDYLPYKDWVKINNAQRCHENLVLHLPCFFANAFICAISFPKFTYYMSVIYLIARVIHAKAYLS